MTMEKFVWSKVKHNLTALFSSGDSSNAPNLCFDSLASVRALIVNPSTCHDTITSISGTLLGCLQNIRQPSHHHLLKLLLDLALSQHHLSHVVFDAVRAYALACCESSLTVEALGVLIMIAEHSRSSSLQPAIAEINGDFLLSLSLSSSVSVRSWIVFNALRFQIRPSFLVAVLLEFTKDPYPYVRRASLDGLLGLSKSENMEKRELIEQCYVRAVELLLDMNACVRSAAIHVVSECGQKLATSDYEVESGDLFDAVFVQICSMARDMSMEVRNEAFISLGTIKGVSEDVLLQSLSKKGKERRHLWRCTTKEFDLPSSDAAGAFVHGLEDEFYEVRRSACNSLGMLTIFSRKFANDSLELLMGLVNDDYLAVRLQTLETMCHMAACNHLKLQEVYMHMFLGTLVDSDILIRSAARNILRSLKQSGLDVFKMSITSLLTNLETYPEDESDIFSVLFSMGKNHGNFAASFFKGVSDEVEPSSDGELSLDSVRVAAILVLVIAAPLSYESQVSQIPKEVFHYAVLYLGRISRSLRDVITQDTLLSYFSKCSQFFHFRAIDSLGEGELSLSVDGDGIQNHNINEIVNHVRPLLQIREESSGKKFKNNLLDLTQTTSAQVYQQKDNFMHDEVHKSVDAILRVISETWMLINLGCTGEVLNTLRSCEVELAALVVNSHGPVSMVAFASRYIRVIHSLAEVWIHFVPHRKHLTLSTGMLNLLLENLDTNLRGLTYHFSGLSKVEELHILELVVLSCVLRLCKVDICCHHNVWKRLHAAISRVEHLQEEGCAELCDFVGEVKKSFTEWGSLGDNKFFYQFPFSRLLKFFSLKQLVLGGRFRHMKANINVPGNDSEKPLPFVSGLPLGITFEITLFNISSKDRLWIKMGVEELIQYVFLDLNKNGGNDEIRKVKLSVPFYRTPKASSFSLRACIGMECPNEDAGNQAKGWGGPKYELTFLCSEKEIYIAAIER